MSLLSLRPISYAIATRLALQISHSLDVASIMTLPVAFVLPHNLVLNLLLHSHSHVCVVSYLANQNVNVYNLYFELVRG